MHTPVTLLLQTGHYLSAIETLFQRPVSNGRWPLHVLYLSKLILKCSDNIYNNIKYVFSLKIV